MASPMTRFPADRRTRLFSLAQLLAQRSQLLLLLSSQPAHNFCDLAGMLGKDSGNQFSAGRSDGCQDKTLVFTLLAALDQSTFLEVAQHQGEIAAAPENTARQIAQGKRPHMIQSFKDGKLAVAEPSLFQPALGVCLRSIAGPRHLDVSVQRELLRTIAFGSSSHRFQIYCEEALSSEPSAITLSPTLLIGDS